MLKLKRWFRVYFARRSVRSQIRSGQLTPVSLGRLIHEQEVYLLGNGPSLGALLARYATGLAKKPLLCVNSMATTEYFHILKPKYYVLADPLYWSEELFSKLDLPVEAKRALPYFHHIVQIGELIRCLCTLVTWEMDFFLPNGLGPERLISRLQRNPNIHFHRFPTGTIRSGDEEFDRELVEAGYSSVGAQNVLVCAIYLSTIARVRSVYLLGADHSFHLDLVVNDDNLVCTRDTHFYENQSQPSLVPSYADLAKTMTLTMKEWFESIASMFEQHGRLQTLSQRLGTSIVNVTQGSFIDAYPRADIASVLSEEVEEAP